MECHDAQAAVSEALDGAMTDAAVLEAAKQHCRDCADCGAFVRALTAVKRAGLPEPSPDLVDRVMAAVHSEAAAKQASADAAAAAAATSEAGAAISVVAGVATASDAVGQGAQATGTTAGSPRGRRPKPAVLAAWVAAAAVLAAGFGAVGVMGVRMMSKSPTLKESGLSSTSRTIGGPGQSQSAAPSAGSADNAVVADEPNYIAFNGGAYLLVGPATTDKNKLRQLGSTRSSLDGSNLRSREVLGAGGMQRVYVEDDKGQLLEFEAVERKYAGRTFQLTSGEISAFGQWPSLPPDIAKPTGDDGSPTFSAAGSDSSGGTVYRKTTSTISQGIAIAPGTEATDPAGGNPNWTWWVPSSGAG